MEAQRTGCISKRGRKNMKVQGREREAMGEERHKQRGKKAKWREEETEGEKGIQQLQIV